MLQIQQDRREDKKEGIFGMTVTSCVCLAIATVFFLVGCISYSNKLVDLRRTAWLVWDGNTSVTAFVGLKKYLVDIKGPGGTMDSHVFTYSADSCTGAYCDKCETDGDAAFGLMVGATVFAGFGTMGQMAAFAIPFNYLVPSQAYSIVLGILAGCTSIVAIGIFVDGPCYHHIRDTLPPHRNFTYGNGVIIALTGFFLCWISVVLNMVSAILTLQLQRAETAAELAVVPPVTAGTSSNPAPAAAPPKALSTAGPTAGPAPTTTVVTDRPTYASATAPPADSQV